MARPADDKNCRPSFGVGGHFCVVGAMEPDRPFFEATVKGLLDDARLPELLASLRVLCGHSEEQYDFRDHRLVKSTSAGVASAEVHMRESLMPDNNSWYATCTCPPPIRTHSQRLVLVMGMASSSSLTLPRRCRCMRHIRRSMNTGRDRVDKADILSVTLMSISGDNGKECMASLGMKEVSSHVAKGFLFQWSTPNITISILKISDRQTSISSSPLRPHAATVSSAAGDVDPGIFPYHVVEVTGRVPDRPKDTATEVAAVGDLLSGVLAVPCGMMLYDEKGQRRLP